MSRHSRSPTSTHQSYIHHHSNRRTLQWVGDLRLSPHERAVDPAMPPSDTESAIYTSDSDAESSRSVPPSFLLRFPNGTQKHVSEDYYSPQSGRSRASSRPPYHHDSRSRSVYPSAHVSGHPLTHLSPNDMPPPETIRVLPPHQRAASGITGRVNSGPIKQYPPQTSPPLGPNSRQRHMDGWIQAYGPPQVIKTSNSHPPYPPSKYDVPTPSTNPHRRNSSSKHSRSSVMGSPSSQMSQLTKQNTLLNSQSRVQLPGSVGDNWSMAEGEELDRPRAPYCRRRSSSLSSNSPPPLTYSRSRTNSSSSQSPGHLSVPQMMSVSFVPRSYCKANG